MKIIIRVYKITEKIVTKSLSIVSLPLYIFLMTLWGKYWFFYIRFTARYHNVNLFIKYFKIYSYEFSIWLCYLQLGFFLFFFFQYMDLLCYLMMNWLVLQNSLS